MPATQKEFLSRLGMLAKACDFALTQDWVALYDRALRKFGYDRAVTAIEEAIIERRGNDRMPSIGDLVHRCAPQVQERDTASEAAARIVAAVPKFGRYANPADVRDWVGSVAWYVIERLGGWATFCGSYGLCTDSRELTNWKAQLRDHAAAAVRRHKAGLLGVAPAFGEGSHGQERVHALVGQVLKKSEEHDGSTRDPGGLPRGPAHRQFDAQGHAGVPQAL